VKGTEGDVITFTTDVACRGTLRFNRTGSFDAGIRCDGWGRVVMEVRVE
jgi:hypothetical protein